MAQLIGGEIVFGVFVGKEYIFNGHKSGAGTASFLTIKGPTLEVMGYWMGFFIVAVKLA